MKKVLSTLAMALTLGVGASLTSLPANAQDYWDDYDAGLWDSDVWADDDYGYYDEDFGWETDDTEWDSWYGDTDTDWDTYDDVGDEGWWDV